MCHPTHLIHYFNFLEEVAFMFKEFFEVRDNEIDIQGVVNNSNYLIYMAHARHKFLDEIGIDFSEMAKKNQLLFLTSSNIEFKKPLKPKDKFYVTCTILPTSKIKIFIEQEIRLTNTDELVAKAVNTAACINGNNNRPYLPEEMKMFIEKNHASI